MELKVQIPFQQLLTAVKSLTPSQKTRLRQELAEENLNAEEDKDEFIKMLLSGPVYNEKQIAVINDNRKSIAKWRTS